MKPPSPHPNARSDRSIARRLIGSSDLKEAMEQVLSDASIPFGDRLFFSAQIMDACGMREKAAANTPPDVLEAVRSGKMDQLIIKTAGAAGSQRQRAAIELDLRTKLVFLCRNFDRSISDRDVDRAYEAAAAAGNPTAQARVIDKRLADSAVQNYSKLPAAFRDGLEKPGGFPDPITPTEQSQLIGALFSEDPISVRHAGLVMSTGSDQQSLRIGADQVDLGQRADETWTLAACQFGFECGPMNASVNYACAHGGQCAANYEELLREYVLTPEEFARIQRNSQLIVDAIRRQDASAFALVNSPGQVRMILAVPGLVRIH